MTRTLDGTGEQTEDTKTNGSGVIEEHPVLDRPRHHESPPLSQDHVDQGTLPVLDNVYPAREERRAQVSGKEIEDIDDHTA